MVVSDQMVSDGKSDFKVNPVVHFDMDFDLGFANLPVDNGKFVLHLKTPPDYVPNKGSKTLKTIVTVIFVLNTIHV